MFFCIYVLSYNEKVKSAKQMSSYCSSLYFHFLERHFSYLYVINLLDKCHISDAPQKVLSWVAVLTNTLLLNISTGGIENK